jgi:TPR repeat protein
MKKLMFICTWLLFATIACAPLSPEQQRERGKDLYAQGHELLLSLGADSQTFYEPETPRLGRFVLLPPDNAEKREVLLRALALLQEAEEYGSAQAALELAFIYDQTKAGDSLGLGEEKHLARYRYYLQRAEAADLPLARRLLAIDYLAGGNGYEQDVDKGLELLEKNAETGNPYAWRTLMIFYAEHLDQYPEKYIYWLEKGAERGDGAIQVQMGVNFEKGYYPFPQSYEKAKYWYEKAAANNSELGLHYLGHLYLLGQGVDLDYAKARELFAKAAELEDWGGAAHHLGEIYYHGLGVKRDYREAFKWFMRGATGGARGAYYGSMYMAAYMYYKGLGVKASRGNAKIWNDLAREAEYDDGYAQSQYMKPVIAYLRKIFR